MDIHIFPLRGLIIFFFNLVFIVKALPTSHFTSTDDELNPLFSPKEQSSGGVSSSLLNSNLFNSGSNLHNSQDVPDFLALASTSTDATQSLFHDFGQPGTDIGSSGNKDLFGDLGLPSGSEDFSLADDTLAFNDAGSDRTNQAASPDLFMEGNPGESSSTSSSVATTLLTPDDKPLSGDFTMPDSVNPGEGTVLGDDTTLNPAEPADVSSVPEDDSLFGHEDSAADASLLGGSSATDPVDSVEDTSSSALDNTEGTLVASAKKITLDGSTTPPKCPGQKTPACCLSAKADTTFTLPGYKGGCISRTCFSGVSDHCVQIMRQTTMRCH